MMKYNQIQIVDEEAQEAEAELQLWIAHQMEQEEQDKLDLRLYHEMQQEQECSQRYEFVNPLPIMTTDKPDIYQELWKCISCGHMLVLTIHVGVRD